VRVYVPTPNSEEPQSLEHYLLKAASFRVVENWKNISGFEKLKNNAIFCELANEKIKIVPYNQIAIESSAVLTELNSTRLAICLNSLGIVPTLRFNALDSQSNITFHPRRGSTLGGAISDFTPNGPIRFSESEFLQADVPIISGHRYLVIASTQQINNEPAEGHVGFDFGNNVQWFTPFAVDPVGKFSYWIFEAPAQSKNAVLLLGHHRLAPIAILDFTLIDLDL
jgi:hypothetical protein